MMHAFRLPSHPKINKTDKTLTKNNNSFKKYIL